MKKFVVSLFLAALVVGLAYATIGPGSDPPYSYEVLQTTLTNVSMRANASPGDPVICGFIVDNDSMAVIRAVGPGLTQFGVEGVLKNPQLTIFRGSERIWSNDDWDRYPNRIEDLQEAFRWVYAFDLDQGSGDAATIVRFSRGNYTVHVKDEGKGSGQVLVEVYPINVQFNPGVPGFVGRANNI